MTISATDFQLRVNEYFTKLIQGEEVIIERYGKKFAVLLPYSEFDEYQQKKSLELPADIPTEPLPDSPTEPLPINSDHDSTMVTSSEVSAPAAVTTAPPLQSTTSESITPEELSKLLKILLAQV